MLMGDFHPPLESAMKTVAGSLSFLLLTLLCFEASGGDKEQDKKKRPYASAAADCDKAIAGKKSSLAESYSSEVWSLKQRFQNDGDLEKALAADKEWSRSIRREPLTPDDLVESPKELRTLQDAYVERQERVEQEVAADVVRDLEREAKEVAQAGNLTDGRVLQQEIDKIKRLYLSDTNTKAKRSATNESKAAAGKNNPEDPITACEEAIRQKRVAIQAQYVGELEALEKSFQAKGALEDVFAAKGERKRFMETPLLTEENLVETPDALLELQRKYLELQQTVTTSVAEEFIARLEQQKQALTIEGKLEEALKTKNNAQALAGRFLEVDDTAKKRISRNSPEKLIIGRWACRNLGDGNRFVFVFFENGEVVNADSGRLSGRWRMQDGLPVIEHFDGWWDKVTELSEKEIQFYNKVGDKCIGTRIK